MARPPSGGNGPDKAPVRHTDPETSHLAARSVNYTALEAVVLAILKASPGHPLTAIEIARKAGCGRDSISPRMKVLRGQKQVIMMGKRHCLNDNGNLRPMMTYTLRPPDTAPGTMSKLFKDDIDPW